MSWHIPIASNCVTTIYQLRGFSRYLGVSPWVAVRAPEKKNLLGDGIAALEAWGEARSVPPAMNKMGQGAIF